MAQWNSNPAYTELDQIMAEEATRKIGLTAEQFNKVMYNIAYLKKLYGLYKCDIGNITIEYAAPGADFDVEIVHRQETVDGELIDYLDFKFTVATAKITASTQVEQIEPTAQADVEATPTKLPDNKGYNINFKFKLPRTKTNCVDDNKGGEVKYTFSAEEDITFTAENISKIVFTIPATVAHGFYAGANFKVGASVPEVVFSNLSGKPLKLMKRGVTTTEYSFNPNSTEMLVILCDGINVCCNLIEV